jgi:cell division septation protein DedD
MLPEGAPNLAGAAPEGYLNANGESVPNVRNLEQIQETDHEGSSTRLATIMLAAIFGAAVVATGIFTFKQSAPPKESKADPLASLVQKAKHPETTPPEAVHPSEVTFPSILSDSERPTTALAAVKDERGHLVGPSDAPPPVPALPPPPAAEKLPVVPLPAGTLLDATSVTTEPKDRLVALASDVSKVTGPLAMPGTEGGYQLQVASFRDQPDADRLVEELRKRGHRAYRQAAYVADRGLWHRVRIGPFKTKIAAEKYKSEFDGKERLSAFLVDPEKVKRQEEIRASKLAARAEER